MRLLTVVGTAAIAALFIAGPASAKAGSTDSSTTRAKCSAGDANVMVDPKTKTYTMDTAADRDAASAGPKTSSTTGGTTPNDNGKAAAGAPAADGAAADSAAASGAMAGKSGAMSGMKSMCKSDADSMGAKMMPASTPKKM